MHIQCRDYEAVGFEISIMKSIYCNLEDATAEQHLAGLKRLESFGYRVDYGSNYAWSEDNEKWRSHYELYLSTTSLTERSWYRTHFAELVVDSFRKHLEDVFGEQLSVEVESSTNCEQYIAFLQACDRDDFLRYICWSTLRNCLSYGYDEAFLRLYRKVNPELENEPEECKNDENETSN